MKKIWCNSLMLLFVIMVVAGMNMSCSKAKESIEQNLLESQSQIKEESKPCYVSGVQMLSDAKLYEDYKPISLCYKGVEYSLDDVNKICNTLKIPLSELKATRLIKSETEGKISFDCEHFNERWSIFEEEDFKALNSKRFKERLLFGDGSDFEYDNFNEIFLTDITYIENSSLLDEDYDTFVKFELRNSESYEMKGFYFVPLEKVKEDEKFIGIQEKLRE